MIGGDPAPCAIGREGKGCHPARNSGRKVKTRGREAESIDRRSLFTTLTLDTAGSEHARVQYASCLTTLPPTASPPGHRHEPRPGASGRQQERVVAASISALCKCRTALGTCTPAPEGQTREARARSLQPRRLLRPRWPVFHRPPRIQTGTRPPRKMHQVIFACISCCPPCMRPSGPRLPALPFCSLDRPVSWRPPFLAQALHRPSPCLWTCCPAVL